MIPNVPPDGDINLNALGFDVDGNPRVDVLRCKTCRKGLDTSETNILFCPYCLGNEWTSKTGILTFSEQVRLYRMTGFWFTTPANGKWNKFFGRLLP